MATKTWVGGNGGGTEDYSIAANWSPSGVPGASDDVVVPPTAAYGITAGLNQSAVSLASFTVERGFTKPIGTSSAYLQITTGKFSYEGSAQSWIDLSASAVSPNVLGTASVSTAGQHGLYLKGSAIATLSVVAGKVAVAAKPGETSTVTTARCLGGALYLGAGVTVTTVDHVRGSGLYWCPITTLRVYGGDAATLGAGAITTLTVYGGRLAASSTGTITTLTLHGGTTDLTQSGQARTITNLRHNPGGTVIYDPNVITITNRLAPDFAGSWQATAL